MSTLRIAVAQLNCVVGDLDHNAALILDAARRAAEQGADLLLTVKNNQRRLYRQIASQFGTLRLGQGIEVLVVLLDRLLQRLLFVLGTLPGLTKQYVARADKGDATEDRTRRAVAPMQHQQLFIQLLADAGNYPRTQLRQQRLALTEHGHRIVIAAQHQQLGAALAQLNNKVVVQLAGITGRRAGVEDIPSHQHGIHLLRLHLLDQPGEKRLMLDLAGLAHKVLAKVPVGAVQNAHA